MHVYIPLDDEMGLDLLYNCVTLKYF